MSYLTKDLSKEIIKMSKICIISAYFVLILSRHEQVWLMRLRFEKYLLKCSLIKHTCS